MMQDRSSRPIFPTLQFAILCTSASRNVGYYVLNLLTLGSKALYRIGEPLALTSIPLYLVSHCPKVPRIHLNTLHYPNPPPSQLFSNPCKWPNTMSHTG